MQPTPVLLIRPNHSAKIELARWLATQPDVLVVGVAENLHAVCQGIWEHPASVLLVDLAVADAADESLWSALRVCYPSALLVALFDAACSDKALRLAVAAGARSCLSKDVGEAVLLPALRDALRGIPMIPDDQFFERLWKGDLEAERDSADRHTPDSAAGQLAPRERDILRLLAAGASNREIAAQLRLSEQTVKNRLSEILSKLGLRNRTQAAMWAQEHGLRDD